MIRIPLSILIFSIIIPLALILRIFGRFIDLAVTIREFKRLKKMKADMKLQSTIGTPSTVNNFVRKYVKFKPDYLNTLFDYQQLPITSLLRGKGDCDDFVMLYKSLLKDKYECRTFATFKWGHIGHVMLAIKTNNGYYIGSNRDMFSIRANSWQEAYDQGAKKFYRSDDYLCSLSYIPWLEIPYVINKKP